MNAFESPRRAKWPPSPARLTEKNGMRFLPALVASAAMLAACTNSDQERARQKAREAGRELQHDAKQAADKAGRAVDQAGREIDKGMADATEKAKRAVDNARRDIDKRSSDADRKR